MRINFDNFILNVYSLTLHHKYPNTRFWCYIFQFEPFKGLTLVNVN